MSRLSAPGTEEIRRKVLDHLYWDSRIDASGIQISVAGQTVHLTGTVPAFSDREHAGSDALMTPGVAAVVNDLQVRFPGVYRAPGDQVIKSNIENTYRWNSDINSTGIQVAVDGGVVLLRGSVDAYWEKERAGQLARDTAGVTGVVNLLAVVPAETYKDEVIANDLISALDRNTAIDMSRIEVKVISGEVTLSGTVPDRSARNAAQNIAAFTSGVIKVINDLKISN